MHIFCYLCNLSYLCSSKRHNIGLYKGINHTHSYGSVVPFLRYKTKKLDI